MLLLQLYSKKQVVSDKFKLIGAGIVRKLNCYRNVPLYTTTEGTPSSFLAVAKASMTEEGFEKSLWMCNSSAVAVLFLEATATRYPLAANARAQLWPILGPAPRMRTTGDMLGMIVKNEVLKEVG
jgi:hypothetical protein